MKTAAAVIVLVVMPLGFFVLAAMIVNRVLAKRRQPCPDRMLGDSSERGS
jgi:cytochrome c-type biogenesis protein CcmH/NrfF